MSEPRVLVFGTSYIKDQTDYWVVRQWAHLARTLSPSSDLLIVDSASPVSPPPDVEVLQLGDNIGHLSKGGRDGWGRAFCAGLLHGWDSYDYIVHIETDLLFVRSVMPTINRIRDMAVPCVMPMALPYAFIETALMFIRPALARSLAHVYDWENGTEQPENRIERLLDGHFLLARLRGFRDDMGAVNPDGLDYLTHSNVAKYRALLAQAGLEEAP